MKNDLVLYGTCLGGALDWKDFERLAQRHGFADPRFVENRPLETSTSTTVFLMDAERATRSTRREAIRQAATHRLATADT